MQEHADGVASVQTIVHDQCAFDFAPTERAPGTEVKHLVPALEVLRHDPGFELRWRRLRKVICTLIT